MRTEETTCSCRFFSSAVTPSRFCPTTAPEPTNLEITQGDMSPVTSVCGATATVSIQGFLLFVFYFFVRVYNHFKGYVYIFIHIPGVTCNMLQMNQPLHPPKSPVFTASGGSSPPTRCCNLEETV
ncbi:hypothetical protein AB205_0099410 [Aquarana catesbeiana]|uniref:Uncharacterized protein n=1 Tax=Aquarana catesbeiana TaxID=8400 RepID=A0A2G9S5R8_AQUCT|nr:hypothetical protein AB205_0099410 [Aquarana catesbeiana]